jgi:hypothetical protein
VLNLLIEAAALLLTVGNGSVDEGGVLGLLGSSQDQGGVGGGILGLVLANGCVMLAHHSLLRKSICGQFPGYILAKSPREFVSCVPCV